VAVRDLMSRTYSSQTSLYEAVSDRIGRNLTPTAQGLTMRQLVDRLKERDSGKRADRPAGQLGDSVSLLSPGVTGLPAGRGVGKSTSTPTLPVSAPSPGRGPVLTSFPKPIAVLSLSRKTGGTATRGAPIPASDLLADVATNASAHGVAVDAELKRRYELRPDAAAAVLSNEVQAYWHAVDHVAPDASLPDHRPQWEDGIIARLAASASRNGGGGGGGPLKRWKDPDLVVPAYLVDKYGVAPFMPRPPTISPAVLVETMFNEVLRNFVHAVKTAVLNYALQSTNAAHHHGLTLHYVDSLRFVPRPPATRASCGVSYTTLPTAAVRIARQLHVTEPVLLQLMAAWYAPRSGGAIGAGGGGGGSGAGAGTSFSSTAATVFSSPEFKRMLPLTLDEVSTAIETQTDKALAVLRGQWHRESAELVAAFVLEVEAKRAALQAAVAAGTAPSAAGGAAALDDAAVPLSASAITASSAAGRAGAAKSPAASAVSPRRGGAAGAGDVVSAAMPVESPAASHAWRTAYNALLEADPRLADVVRAAVAMLRGALWSAGLAPGQQYEPGVSVSGDAAASPGFGASGGFASGLSAGAAATTIRATSRSGGPAISATARSAGRGPLRLPALGTITSLGDGVEGALRTYDEDDAEVAAVTAADLGASHQPASAAVDGRQLLLADAATDSLIAALLRHKEPAPAAGATMGSSGSPARTALVGSSSAPLLGGRSAAASYLSPSRHLPAFTAAAGLTAEGSIVQVAGLGGPSLPALSDLASLPPSQLGDWVARLMCMVEGSDAVIARRLQGTFSAAARLMGMCLHQVVYAGVADFHKLLARYVAYSPRAIAGMAEGIHAQSYAYSADAPSAGAGGGMTARRTGFVAIVHGPDGGHTTRAPSAHAHVADPASRVDFLDPLLRQSMVVNFGSGSTHAGANFLEFVTPTNSRQAALARAGGGGGGGAAGGDGGAAAGGGLAAARAKRDRRVSAAEKSPLPGGGGGGGGQGTRGGDSMAGAAAAAVGKKAATPAQQAAYAVLEETAGDLTPPAAPVPGEELAKLWCGEVVFSLDPGWEAVDAALQRNLESIVAAYTTFPRVEADIAAASGVAPSAMTSARSPGAGGLSTTGGSGPGGGGGGAGKGHTLLELMSMQGLLSSVPLDDPAVRDARELVHRVVALNRVIPDQLLSRFDAFLYLFSPQEKARVLAFVHDTSNTVVEYQAELEKFDAVVQQVDAVCDNLVVFPFVTISTVPLKDALKSRVRLLCTLLMRHVKSQAMHTCEVLNVKYTRISRKLLFKPGTSEELVALNEFTHSLDLELKSLERAMYGTNGVCDWIRLLHNEGLAREYQRTQAGAIVAAGPTVQSHYANENAAAAVGIAMGTMGGSGAGGSRRNSAAGQQAAAEMEALPFTRVQMAILKDALTWPAKVRQDVTICQSVLDEEKAALVDKLAYRVGEYMREFTETRHMLDRLANEGAMNRVSQATTLVKTIATRLESAQSECDAINQQQELLEQPVVDYATDIKEATVRLAPFEKLWTAIAAYLSNTGRWYDQALLTNNADEALKEAENQRASAAKVLRELPEEATAPRTLLSKVRDDLEHFVNTDQPLLALLANPGLKERHWTSMEAAVGFDLPHTAQSTLSDMLELKLDAHIDKIEEFCVNASKEYSLERALDRMEAEWKPVAVELKAHSTSGTYILTGASSEEIQALLDDHIVKSTTMAASRYARPLEARIKEWVAGLVEMQAVLEVWLKVQSTWLYLSPIFSSEDIMHQMPIEGQRFQQVDGTWRTLMRGCSADPRAIHALRQTGMLASLKEAHDLLEKILKGLNDYLESKRLIFPRFFFLSNDELLEILAETKDPLRVQPHLRKCFEGINALQFDSSGAILGMVSAEGERVTFTAAPDAGGRMINPADARGCVEVWLLQVEAAMKRACARVVDEAVRSYGTAETRSSWTLKWAAQAVLAVTQMFWTQEVEAAIRGGAPNALRDYATKCTAQIEDIIMLVRGKLSKLARTTLGALVVLDVHARDVVAHMAKVDVRKVTDFDWNSQLRYYWTDDGQSAMTGLPHTTTMRMINAALKYGYEYLGNTTRLVITPLTDRCYRTLMGAVHLGLGGAPEGPAGEQPPTGCACDAIRAPRPSLLPPAQAPGRQRR